MKKLAITLALMAFLTSVAMAGQVVVGNSTYGYGPYQTGIGGEFTLTPINPTGWLDLSHYGTGATNVRGIAGSFQTFCIEGQENIYPYSAVYNAVVQKNAMNGGVGPAGDPISLGAGWLYSQFASGTWIGSLTYNYTSTSARQSDADLLQKALWWLEGEENITYTSANKYMLAVVNKFGDQAAAKADGGWHYGVYALHLTTASGGLVQDQLYYDGVPVPDSGATVMLLGFALAGLGYISRKFKA